MLQCCNVVAGDYISLHVSYDPASMFYTFVTHLCLKLLRISLC
uniref:Uncharacterized protein n=1 Tax=Arundo donax TaxID=35708 RepID=A0A0A9GES9_ARUDO